MLRSMLTVAVATVVVALSGLSADAGLFSRKSNCGGCAPVASCAAPAPVCGGCDTGCGRVKRVKIKRSRGCCNVGPSCCAPAPAPTCCAPAPAPTCAAPAPACCAPAAPSCCAPAAPSCAAPMAPAAAPVETIDAAPKAPVPPKEGGAQ